MINYEKFQKECVNVLLRSGRVSYDDLGDNKYLVSYNGTVAVVLSKNQIVFNLDKCQETAFKSVIDPAKGDTEIRKTINLKKADGRFIERWDAEKFSIWFNKSYADFFADDSVIKAESPVKRAIVYSRTGDVIGVIMPVRVRED